MSSHALAAQWESPFIVVRAEGTSVADDEGPTLSERDLLPALLGYGRAIAAPDPGEATQLSVRPIARVVGPRPRATEPRRRSPSLGMRGRPITDVFRIVEDVYATPPPSEDAAMRDARAARRETEPLPVFRAAETGSDAFASVHIVDLDAPEPTARPPRGDRRTTPPGRVVRVRPPRPPVPARSERPRRLGS